MTTFNVMAGGRRQLLVDEQQFQQLQSEIERRGLELDRLKQSMEVLSAINTPAHFMAAAMALCNEMASRWHAERVGIGFLKGRYVRLLALSHTEKITRHMQLVQDIEGAMEECLDQDVEILYPPPKEASFVYRSTETLAGQHGPNAVISLPLRRDNQHLKERQDQRFGSVVAVLTVERKAEKPFTLQEIETLRLTCDLFTARLVDLYENDRWAGAKALRGTRRALAWAVGAKHTWAKVAAIAICGFLAFAFLKNGMYHVEAPFVIVAVDRQVINAPMDGRIEKVNVDVNDLVFSGKTAKGFDDLNGASPLVQVLPVDRPPTVLLTMDTGQLEAERAVHASQVRVYQADAQKYDSEGKHSDAQQALVRADMEQKNVDALNLKIEEATIRAPIDGRVFSGELKGKEGTIVRVGDKLFEIGTDEIQAELSVPEDQITEVKEGQAGVLKATSFPGRSIHFTVERIYPMATVSGTKNVFKVRVKLDSRDAAWLSPGGVGVEGLAKIDVEPAKYAWIWSNRMINWVRMKLWM